MYAATAPADLSASFCILGLGRNTPQNPSKKGFLHFLHFPLWRVVGCIGIRWERIPDASQIDNNRSIAVVRNQRLNLPSVFPKAEWASWNARESHKSCYY